MANIKSNIKSVRKTIKRKKRNSAVKSTYKTLVKKIIDGLSIKAKEIKKTGRTNKFTFSDYKNLIIQNFTPNAQKMLTELYK